GAASGGGARGGRAPAPTAAPTRGGSGGGTPRRGGARGGRTREPRRCPSPPPRRGSGPEGRADHARRPLGLVVGQHERRSEPDDGVAVERPAEDQARVERAAREADRGVRRGELEAQKEAKAAHGDEPAATDERGELPAEPFTERRGTGHEPVAQQDL